MPGGHGDATFSAFHQISTTVRALHFCRKWNLSYIFYALAALDSASPIDVL
jgi:hypothetical protein